MTRMAIATETVLFADPNKYPADLESLRESSLRIDFERLKAILNTAIDYYKAKGDGRDVQPEHVVGPTLAVIIMKMTTQGQCIQKAQCMTLLRDWCGTYAFGGLGDL